MAPVAANAAAATWPADVPVPSKCDSVLSARGEPYNPTLHAQGRCLPCNLTECSRNCSRARKGLCKTFDGVERCHHEDHRQTQRKGKRERLQEKREAVDAQVAVAEGIDKNITDPVQPEKPGQSQLTSQRPSLEARATSAVAPRRSWADIMDEEGFGDDSVEGGLNSLDDSSVLEGGTSLKLLDVGEGCARKAADLDISPRKRWADIMEEESDNEFAEEGFDEADEESDLDLVMQF